MRDRLKAALAARQPAIADNYIDRYVKKYVSTVMAEIALRYMLISSEELNDGEINFSADQVSRACGRYKCEGATGYIYALMQEHPSTSLVVSVYTGTNLKNRVSRVIFNPIYKKEIMQELASLTIECNPQHLRELQAKANMRIEIDPASLSSYIEQTRLTLKEDHPEAYGDKLVRNLQIANQLLDLAVEDGGVAYLNEYWEHIDSGRIHGHGLSLQRIPKEVRHAALGQCYRYDFKAASYALMTSLALHFDPALKTAALQEYVRYRAIIRKRIAADIGVSEKWVKDIFTALGFGAELKDNPHNTIRKKLGQEKYHKLMANAEFMLISRQLQQVSDVILKNIGSGDFEWLGKTYAELNPKDGVKRTKNQKLAWLYQCMESDALNAFVEMIPDTYTVKLLVHDAVYLDRRLSDTCITDIKLALQKRYKLLNFEGDEITPIHTESYVSRVQQAHATAKKEHAQVMKAAELRARGNYVPSAFCSITASSATALTQ